MKLFSYEQLSRLCNEKFFRCSECYETISEEEQHCPTCGNIFLSYEGSSIVDTGNMQDYEEQYD